MYDALRAFGFLSSQVGYVIPKRLGDGYDLKWGVVKRHISDKGWRKARPNLVIAVDCGTTASKAVTELLNEKMDVIILDHHAPDHKKPLPLEPDRVFHLNPKLWIGREGWEPEHRMENMCASGLAYLFGLSLLAGCRARQKWEDDRALLLAGLATCVDVMELTGINRVLLKRSLSLANIPSRLALVPGLAKLKSRMGPQPKSGLAVTEETYGFYWGPCINAAGRRANADEAAKLLMSRHAGMAGKKAAECIESSRWRKATELAMFAEARIKADEQLARDNPSILVVCSPTWHPGVVGIVASRLKELYGRPAIVGSLHLTPTKEKPTEDPSAEATKDTKKEPAKQDLHRVIWKASGRSVEGCNMGKLFHAATEGNIITQGGGHPMAGGLSFSEEQRKDLHLKLGKESGFDPAKRVTWVEVAAPASSLPPPQWAWLFKRLAPFGNGNPCPALIVEAAELIGVRVRTRVVQPALHRIKSTQSELGLDQNSGSNSSNRAKPKTNYWEFSTSEIKDLEAFLERLRGKTDAVSCYLWEQLEPSTVAALERRRDSQKDSELFLQLLVSNLNRIIKDPALYDPTRFERIKLRSDTKTVWRQGAKGKALIQFNRLLLEDAYPKELCRQELQGMPRVFAYEGQFRDKVTGKIFFAQWLDLEQAEVLWQVHRFFRAFREGDATPRLPDVFRLQLELRSLVPLREWSNIYRGKSFQRDYRFQVRQCITLDLEHISTLRMPERKKVDRV